MDSLDKKFYISLGNILKEKRKQKGYSLQYIVDKMGGKNKVSKQTLSKYETGKIRMNTNVFNEICKILNEDPQKILDLVKFN